MRTRVLAVAAVALAVAVLLSAGMLLAGTIGLVGSALLASAAAVCVVRVRLGTDERPPRPARPAPWSLEPFHTYRRIAFQVSWDTEHPSPGTTRLLTRLAGAVLAERHGVDINRDPDTARRLLGERAWAQLQPQHDCEVEMSVQAEIAHVVDRLEGL